MGLRIIFQNAGETTMSAYAIMIRERMKDAAAFAEYGKLAPAARVEGLKALAFYGKHEVVEGEGAEGVVILEFPDMASAKGWYNSPAYQAALVERLKGADYRVIFVEGI
jgi:uncharacterized protein (DUF1330 family)